MILSTIAWFRSISQLGDSPKPSISRPLTLVGPLAAIFDKSNPSVLLPLTHFGPKATLPDQIQTFDSATPQTLWAHGYPSRSVQPLELMQTYDSVNP